MTSGRRLLSYGLFILGLSLLTGSALYYFHTRQPASDLSADNVPKTIAGLPLVEILTGREAIENIHKLHGADFPLEGGIVAVYGNQNLTLWVSDAGSIFAARDLIGLMTGRIAERNSPFTMLGDLDLEGDTVYALDGMGQAHYYWQSGELVLWLAADVSIAQQAIIQCVEFYR